MAASRILRKKQNPYECLERMLNKTTLTTQRVSHNHIIELGEDLLNRTTVVSGENKDQAIADAVKEAEERFQEELATAVKNLQEQLEREREEALLKQKLCFESQQAKALEQWQKAQEEKIRLLKLEYRKHLDEALRSQSTEFEDYRASAVDEAAKRLEKKLRTAFAIEREHAVAEALGKARLKFREREQNIINQTRHRCEEDRKEKIKKLSAQHEEELKAAVSKYESLEEKFSELLEQKTKLEGDFEELQREYMRFIDNTERYHSDYLIIPCSHASITSHSTSLSAFSPHVPHTKR